MPRTRSTRAAALGGSPDETEAAFYEALQRGDIDLLMSCWAEDDEIVCIHPGGPRLLGPGAIRAAFEAMFAHGTVRARPVQVHRVQALASAVHSVAEQVEVMLPDGLHQAVVLATNVYHKTPEGWRMVAHHASAGTVPDPQVVDAQRPVLH
ncbi:MAG: nuclear transport factor 2 family protein [Acidovorax sp.]|uniref:YybH family protein n=1 Tax=Acidovorax sp. TaxID=1872122 RepID=UPI0039E2FAC3